MLTIEKLYEKLKRVYNVEKDELDALGFKSGEQVREYYQNVARQSKNIHTEEEKEDKSDPTPVDKYTLSPKRLAQLKGFDKTLKADRKQADANKFYKGAADLSHLPPDEQVSHDDVQAAMDALNPPKSKKASKIKLPPKKK